MKKIQEQKQKKIWRIKNKSKKKHIVC
jgi:hypothetical protein